MSFWRACWGSTPDRRLLLSTPKQSRTAQRRTFAGPFETSSPPRGLRAAAARDHAGVPPRSVWGIDQALTESEATGRAKALNKELGAVHEPNDYYVTVQDADGNGRWSDAPGSRSRRVGRSAPSTG